MVIEESMVYLSIIIPVYNSENYLEACIESILKQSFMDYEIILIDDGSTDRSGSICDAYSIKDKRIKVFHVINGGPSKARNYALTIASGRYVEFIDSDDCIEPEALVQIYEKVSENNAEVFVMNTNIVDGNDNVIDFLKAPHIGRSTVDNIICSLTIMSKPIYMHYLWNKWYSLEFLKKNSISFCENIKLGEDFLFNCEIFKLAEVVKGVDVSLYRYFRRNNESLSSCVFRVDDLQRRRIMDSAFIDLYKSRNLYNVEIRERIDGMIGRMTLESVNRVFGKNHPDSNKQEEYVNEFLDSEYYNYLIKYASYANLENVGIAKLVNLRLLKMRCTKVFLFVNKVWQILREML